MARMLECPYTETRTNDDQCEGHGQHILFVLLLREEKKERAREREKERESQRERESERE